MVDRIVTGKEHGVEWKVDRTKFDPVIISVKGLKTGQKQEIAYNCIYRPIFGYDVLDSANIEKILDDLIVKYADDGYKGMEQ